MDGPCGYLERGREIICNTRIEALNLHTLKRAYSSAYDIILTSRLKHTYLQHFSII